MTESVDRQTAVLRLRGADDILILCHKNPDGDTIGCAGALYLALKALGKNAAILCSDPIPKMYDYMELRWFDGSFNPAFVVAVDVASIQLFGENNNVPQYAAHSRPVREYSVTCCHVIAWHQVVLTVMEATGSAPETHGIRAIMMGVRKAQHN